MNEQLIEISLENNNTSHFVKEGAKLSQLLMQSGLKTPSPVLGAYVDNHAKELSYRLFSSKSVRFITLENPEGRRIYSRSLFFLLEKAASDIDPSCRFRMMHPIGRGFYCEPTDNRVLTDNQITALRVRMRELIEADLPIVRQKMSFNQALDYCQKQNLQDKVKLLETRPHFYVSFFNLGGKLGYFYGAMVPTTSFLKVFDIESFGDGLAVLMPNRQDHQTAEPICMQPKLYDVFKQHNEWGDIINIANIGELNQQILHGNSGELIKIGEALQEKTFSLIADTINDKHRNGDIRIILIAGPSSSGKTTFSKRLSIQLRVMGLKPLPISLDDYFVERERTPLDADGNYDFEALEAVDVELFNQHLLRILQGEEVTLPKFSFKSGLRSLDGRKIKMDDSSILIIEGIHGLNPALVPHIDRDLQFKIYASALTTLSIDHSTTIHTTDNRLLRRIVRDHNYRGRTAYETLQGWDSVRRGEDKYIFPYQEEADAMFNTALFYELAVLAPIARPLLSMVPATAPEYAESVRLKKFLDYFIELNHNEVPPTSILREFIGGSSFEY